MPCSMPRLLSCEAPRMRPGGRAGHAMLPVALQPLLSQRCCSRAAVCGNSGRGNMRGWFCEPLATEACCLARRALACAPDPAAVLGDAVPTCKQTLAISPSRNWKGAPLRYTPAAGRSCRRRWPRPRRALCALRRRCAQQALSFATHAAQQAPSWRRPQAATRPRRRSFGWRQHRLGRRQSPPGGGSALVLCVRVWVGERKWWATEGGCGGGKGSVFFVFNSVLWTCGAGWHSPRMHTGLCPMRRRVRQPHLTSPPSACPQSL